MNERFSPHENRNEECRFDQLAQPCGAVIPQPEVRAGGNSPEGLVRAHVSELDHQVSTHARDNGTGARCQDCGEMLLDGLVSEVRQGDHLSKSLDPKAVQILGSSDEDLVSGFGGRCQSVFIKSIHG